MSWTGGIFFSVHREPRVRMGSSPLSHCNTQGGSGMGIPVSQGLQEYLASRSHHPRSGQAQCDAPSPPEPKLFSLWKGESRIATMSGLSSLREAGGSLFQDLLVMRGA